MVDEERIKEHLKSGGTVVVADTWYFKKLRMRCITTLENLDWGLSCCDEDYVDYDDAAKAVLFYSTEGDIRYE